MFWFVIDVGCLFAGLCVLIWLFAWSGGFGLWVWVDDGVLVFLGC